MEEVVVVSSEEMEVRAESETEKEEKSETESETESGTEKKMKKKRKRKGGNSSGVVKWERVLRRMMIRVLLVEADDSTRQIIAALLRKCSYRVTAVSDGLKAWEILKGRAHNIDLILTEVDLPSISGFALLTLIMEHEICKKIPIIMMSAQDSVSTVYKCMLRGAADYLVKPIRRNELRNLWQHVWRKQSSNVGINDPQDESVAQQQAEATAENNAGSNHSSGHMACIQRNAKQIEKGSDAQSSCTKPELEAESAPAENVQEFSQPKRAKSFPSDIIFQNDEAYSNFGQKFSMHEGEAEGSEDACKDDNTTPLGKDLKPECQNRDATITNEAVDNNYVLINSSREAIDLIGAFHNYPNCSSEGISKFDSLPQLDLSLRRSHFIGFCNSYTEEMRTLGHSNASAFTRYTNRALQPPQTKIADASNHQKQYGIDSEKMLSNTATCYSYDTPGITQSTQRITISPATGQSKESEVATSCSQQRVFPVAVPVKGIRINNLCTGFGSVLPPMFCTQSVPSPTPSPSSVAQQEPSFQMNILYRSNLENNNFEQQYDPVRQNTNDAVNQTIQKQEHKLDPLENQGHISPTTDQSASDSVCNGGVSHHNSIGYGSACGSNSNVDHVNFVGASESKNEEGFFPQNGSSHRSIQREVALAKFRLKRKERCYEKKVRYESRKKLAEQRPRVKGQFVRQVLIDEPPTEIVGNSYDG